GRKVCLTACAFLFFLCRTAFRTEFCTLAELGTALYARDLSNFHLAAAVRTELCSRVILLAAGWASHSGSSRSSALLLCSRLAHSERIGHLAPDGKSGPKARPKAGTTALILGRITEGISCLELHIFLGIAECSHRCTLVHRRF